MDKPAPYKRPPFAKAGQVVPVGLHLDTSGQLVFDAPDAALVDDLRTMIAAFSALHPKSKPGKVESLIRANVEGLPAQAQIMTSALEAMLAQMEEPDGRETPELGDMLASTFDRFPQFLDFRVLAAGCGDPLLDPEHADAELAEEARFDHGHGGGNWP